MRDKSITHRARMCLRLINTGLFALVWIFYYNNFAFHTIKVPGALISLLIFYIIYNSLCGVYKAFRIASTSIGEIVFSQFISVGIADLILYVECCLIYHFYVNIAPGAITVALQVVATALLVTYTKRRLMRTIHAGKTVLVSGCLTGLGDIEQFKEKLKERYGFLFDIDEVISEGEPMESIERSIDRATSVMLYDVSPENRQKLIMYCVAEKKDFFFTPRIEDIVMEGCSERHLLDTPLYRYDYPYNSFGRQLAKRIWDIILSLVMIIILSPTLGITALAIKLNDGGPVFFKQKRYTKDEKVFDILKFRSMVVDADKYGVVPTTENDPRVTKVGKFIRSTRIDELPQLFNILKGDMSFVGPRPERIEHVKMYEEELPEFRYRHLVKGGLTGYAQVYGKYNTSPYDKLRLDLEYIENQSWLLDFKLMLLTFRTIFQKESTEGFSEERQEKITATVVNEQREVKLEKNQQEEVQPEMKKAGYARAASENEGRREA